MMEPEHHTTGYIELCHVIAALLNDLLGYVLQEQPEYRILHTVSNLVEENNKLKHELDEALLRISSLEKRLSVYKSSVQLLDSGAATGMIIIAYSELENLMQDEECDSLLKKYLTEEVLDNLIEVETETYNSRLLDCIQAGLQVHNSTIGLFAADSDCYCVFAQLFDPIVRDCHPGLSDDFVHPDLDWGDTSALCYSDEMHLYMDKCSCLCSRSLEAQPFFPKMEKKHYIYVIEAIRTVLEDFCSKYLPGSFYAFEAIDEDTMARLKGDGFMFDDGDEAHEAAGSARHWPTGRAVYVSRDKSFVTYINHKNHIQFGCVQKDGNMKTMYQQMVTYGRIFDEQLPCARHSKYGWLTASPALLGNSLEIQARLRLVKLPTEMGKFSEILKKSNLALAEQVSASNHVFCILRNTRCLGLTEFDTIQGFSAGIENVIRAEKEM